MRQIALLLLVCCGITSVMATPDWVCFKGSPERTSSSDVPAPNTPYLLWKVDLGSELHSSPLVKNGKVFQVAFEEIVCIDCDTGHILWRSPVPAYYYTPALSNEKIIVPTTRGVTAFSIENGDFLWEYSVLETSTDEIDYIVSSPGVSQGKIVVGTVPTILQVPHVGFREGKNMNLVCLDEINGKERWSVETRLGVFSSPCIAYGKVFAASRGMICIDLEKGNVLWNSERKYPWNAEDPIRERYAFGNSTPAIYHGILIAGSCNTRLVGENLHYKGWQKIVALDQYTGDIFWEWAEEGIFYSSPALYQGRIYFYSYDGIVRCLSLKDGSELWRIPISEPQKLYLGGDIGRWPSPAVADGKVYIGSIEGVFYCLDAHTGEILWEYETRGPFHSVPALVPGKVLISSSDGYLYSFGIDPATYKTKAQQYIEEKMYGKAKEFLIKAKDYAKTEEEIRDIDDLLDLVNSEMPEYNKKLDNLAEAESFMDEADKILWNKNFKKAKELYTKAHNIYTEYNDEFGVSFCEKRIDYINRRIAEQSWIEMYWWLLIILGCFGAAFIFLFKKYRR